MKPQDIPEKTFVSIHSKDLDCGFAYGYVKHYGARSGGHGYSTVQVSPTCAFRFPRDARIEKQDFNEMKIEFSIFLPGAEY